MENVVIRPIKKSELALLSDFLYEAIYQPGEQKAPRTVIQDPSVRVYIDGFGSRAGDRCLVAETGGLVVGAVWTRLIDGFGHIDGDTPELAISVCEPYRGRGIGTRLLRGMLAELDADGCDRSSLAVHKDNFAFKMYERAGFSVVRETDQEYIMLRERAHAHDPLGV